MFSVGGLTGRRGLPGGTPAPPVSALSSSSVPVENLPVVSSSEEPTAEKTPPCTRKRRPDPQPPPMG